MRGVLQTCPQIGVSIGASYAVADQSDVSSPWLNAHADALYPKTWNEHAPARRGHCLDGVEGAGRTVLLKDMKL